MRRGIPDFPLAMTLLWIWVGIVAVLVVGWWLVKWWKKRHPPPRPQPELPYSQRLQRRYNQRRAEGGSAGRAPGDKASSSKPRPRS